MTICTSVIRPNLPKRSRAKRPFSRKRHRRLPFRSCSVVRWDNPNTPKTVLGIGFSRWISLLFDAALGLRRDRCGDGERELNETHSISGVTSCDADDKLAISTRWGTARRGSTTVRSSTVTFLRILKNHAFQRRFFERSNRLTARSLIVLQWWWKWEVKLKRLALLGCGWRRNKQMFGRQTNATLRNTSDNFRCYWPIDICLDWLKKKKRLNWSICHSLPSISISNAL